MSIEEFKLPDVGEGLTEAEIVTWNVKVGDTVKVNDVIVEIETAKSLVELPCPYAGMVTELLGAEGETVDVGAPIIAVETGDASAAPPSPRPPRPRWAAPPRTGPVAQGRRSGRARTDRWSGSRGPHVGAGRLRPAHHRSEAAAPQDRVDPASRHRRQRRSGCSTPSPRRDARARRPHRGRRRGRRADRVGRRPFRSAGPDRGCWRSRRCASLPRTSASTSRPSPPPGPTARSPARRPGPRVRSRRRPGRACRGSVSSHGSLVSERRGCRSRACAR